MSKNPDIHALLQKAGKNLPAIDQLANYVYQRRAPLEPVLRAYKKYLRHQPNSANAAFNYAYYLSKDGRFESAVEMYNKAIRLGIETPEEVHLNIANIFMDHLKNTEKAKSHLEQALVINPNYASAYYNLGNLAEQEGDRTEACRCFERCIEFDPSNESALARLADAHVFADENDPLLARVASVAQTSKNIDVHYSIGRVYEQLTQYELAWHHFSKANQLDRLTLPAYKRAVTEDVFQRIMSQCDAQWLARFHGESDESVFICGMFRTGSTLLEQVLAAHPRFVAGGESEFFPRLIAREFRDFPAGLAGLTAQSAEAWRERHGIQVRKLFGDSFRVTDKRPDNFLHIGMIKAVQPSAKFVVTERDWRDVATSVYATRLGPGQNYATSLHDIHHYLDLQKKLIEHWHSILGNDLIRIRYEDLVSRPEPTISALLTSLGEEWDERCLSFDKLKNSVQTASVWQVREPLHTKSVGRWQHFQPHFEAAFGDDLMP